MASNLRVDLKVPAGANGEQRETAFKRMFATFKRRVNDAGILTEHNMRSSYESKGQKLRRKKKESDVRRQSSDEDLNYKLREHFGAG